MLKTSTYLFLNNIQVGMCRAITTKLQLSWSHKNNLHLLAKVQKFNILIFQKICLLWIFKNKALAGFEPTTSRSQPKSVFCSNLSRSSAQEDNFVRVKRASLLWSRSECFLTKLSLLTAVQYSLSSKMMQITRNKKNFDFLW